MSAFSLPIPPQFIHVTMSHHQHTGRSATTQRKVSMFAISDYKFKTLNIFGAYKPTRSASCYAFFKGWLLLSLPPDCLGLYTSFYT